MGDAVDPEQLKYWRGRRGMSQRACAELMGYSASWLQKIEQGKRSEERLSVLRDFARVLQVGIEDLQAQPPGSGETAARPQGHAARGASSAEGPRGLAPQQAPARDAARIGDPAGSDRAGPSRPAVAEPHGDRAGRRATGAGGEVGAGRLPALSERLTLALDRPRRLDPAIVDELESLTAAYRRLYHSTAAEDILDSVVQHVSLAGRFLGAEGSAMYQRRLAATTGEAALLAGRLLFVDLNDREAASPYYNRALRAASQASDPPFHASVLGHVSRALSLGGKRKQALEVLAAARRHAMRGGNATVVAWLAAVEARTWVEGRPFATREEAAASLAALDAAELAMGRAAPGEAPAWFDYFDRSKLHGFRGFCSLRLRRPQDAEAELNQALATLNPVAVKEQACFLADRAAVRVQQREIDEACRMLGQPIAILAETPYATGLQRLRDVRVQLEPWEDTPAVQHLDEQLTELLRV